MPLRDKEHPPQFAGFDIRDGKPHEPREVDGTESDGSGSNATAISSATEDLPAP
jgi:hypothetical protein